MNKSKVFSPEVRERAVRMVQKKSLASIPRCGLRLNRLRRRSAVCHRCCWPGCSALKLTDPRDGMTTADKQRVKDLERENKELRRANENLKLASAFFAQRSSTADSSPEGLHRHTSRYVRGRADLQSSADRPVGISSSCCLPAWSFASLRSCASRRHAGARDPTRLARRLAYTGTQWSAHRRNMINSPTRLIRRIR